MSDINPSGAVISLLSGTGMPIAKGVELNEDIGQSTAGAGHVGSDLRSVVPHLAAAIVALER